MPEALKVLINAQIHPGHGAGGIEQVIIGLVHALGQLDDGVEEYTIIGHWKEPDWLQPYLGPNQRIVPGPKPQVQRALGESTKRLLGPLRNPAGKVWRAAWQRVLGSPKPSLPTVPESDGFYECLGGDVIHFPYQKFICCNLPMIYNPHDLQHLHYPQFFTSSVNAKREVIYPAGCHSSHTVAVASEWIKQDVIRHYRVNPAKVQVIPWAPPTQAYPEPTREKLSLVQQAHGLWQPFALYPAVTWEHKNHLRLLEALAYLRDSYGLTVHLVCTGYRQTSFWPRIEERMSALKLNNQVQFLGILTPGDLRAIYRLAQFVIVPTLFESDSNPVFEAWQDGTPVACSTVTALPDQAGDAALLFDPFSVEAIGEAVRRMATDANVREELHRRGVKRLSDFSWQRTAKAYRAVYRKAAGRPLTEEDRRLLSWDWMREPQRKTEACL